MIEKGNNIPAGGPEYHIDNSEELRSVEEFCEDDSDSKIEVEKIANEIAHSIMESKQVSAESRRVRARRQLLQQLEERGVLFISRKERQEIRSKIDAAISQRELK